MGNLVRRPLFVRDTSDATSQDIRVNGRYQLQLRLGGGSFGEVYQGKKSSKDLVTRD
jgi:hypothetical protein